MFGTIDRFHGEELSRVRRIRHDVALATASGTRSLANVDADARGSSVTGKLLGIGHLVAERIVGDAQDGVEGVGTLERSHQRWWRRRPG